MLEGEGEGVGAVGFDGEDVWGADGVGGGGVVGIEIGVLPCWLRGEALCDAAEETAAADAAYDGGGARVGGGGSMVRLLRG